MTYSRAPSFVLIRLNSQRLNKRDVNNKVDHNHFDAFCFDERCWILWLDVSHSASVILSHCLEIDLPPASHVFFSLYPAVCKCNSVSASTLALSMSLYQFLSLYIWLSVSVTVSQHPLCGSVYALYQFLSLYIRLSVTVSQHPLCGSVCVSLSVFCLSEIRTLCLSHYSFQSLSLGFS